MKATSFETAIDDYSADNHGLMDGEILDNASVREDFLESEVDYDRKPKKSEVKENKYDNNNELRLVNAYFKEVGCETLLKAKEEIEIAAKIKECETQAEIIINTIEKVTGKNSTDSMEDFVQEIKFLINDPTFKKQFSPEEFESLHKHLAVLDIYMKKYG